MEVHGKWELYKKWNSCIFCKVLMGRQAQWVLEKQASHLAWNIVNR